MRRAGAAAALVLLLAGCGRAVSIAPGAAPASPAPAAVPSPSPSPTPSLAPWQLQLTGGLSGSFQGGGAEGRCGPLSGGLAVQLPFQYQGRAFLLDVAIQDYTAPGSYPAPPARVSVHSAGFGNGPPVFYSGVKGTVTVAASGTSGTLDEDLTSQAGPAHVSGSWHC